MKISTKTPRVRGIVAGVRADANSPQALLAELQRTFETFKAENDKHLADIRKGLGDAVQAEKVDRINAAIDDLRSQMTDVASRAALAATAGGGDEEKARRIFAESLRREPGAPAVEVAAEVLRDYRPAFNAYLRRGDAVPAGVKAALSVGSDPDGGYTVTPEMSTRIVEKTYETSDIRRLATVETIGTDAIEGINDLDEAASGWVGETATRSETNTPQVGMWRIPVHEVYANPKATQKLLDDSRFNIEAWLARKVGEKFARAENTAFVSGDGVQKPRGILSYTMATTADSSRAWGAMQYIVTGASGAFPTLSAGVTSPADPLVTLVFSLKAKYRANATWLMPRSVVAEIRKIKDADSNYVWQPNFEMRQGGMLLGYPIVEAEDMPVIAANSYSIAFGDIRETYTIVDRAGVRVLRDPYTSKGNVLFYSTKRVGGGVLNFEATKFLKFGTA